MCLDPEFFIEASKAAEKARQEGYEDLYEVLKANRFTKDDLLVAGLMEEKEILSTADLHNQRLTVKGRRFINSNRRYQLFLVHENRREKLLDKLRQFHPALRDEAALLSIAW